MGAFIALEWAIHHPTQMQGLVLIGAEPESRGQLPARASTSDDLGGHARPRVAWRALRPQPGKDGLRRAGIVYYPWEVSSAYLERIPAKRLGEEMEDMAKSFAGWDANSLVFRYAACREHDVSVPFNGDMAAALGQVRAPVLILASTSDRLLGPYGARRIRDGVRHATYVEVPSDMGHRALGPNSESDEEVYIERAVEKFLAAKN